MNINQEAFDKVWAGIKAQGEPSMEYGNCLYRGNDRPTKCAIGLLLADEDYQPKFDSEKMPFDEVVKASPSLQKYDYSFMTQLQAIHDNSVFFCKPHIGIGFMTAWKQAMRELAEKNNLTVPEDF